ncbi:hypothetical protein CEXT_73271 [Caerostris extrusa]|uniref:Uncharacterized protein n=1 Tax=Caerostris extrusa TaxID=172846 RepID=A0AAV4XLK4_CAEEX|nr:hypothetical protein CEXT_73271 [Caerostris extrusa]
MDLMSFGGGGRGGGPPPPHCQRRKGEIANDGVRGELMRSYFKAQEKRNVRRSALFRGNGNERARNDFRTHECGEMSEALEWEGDASWMCLCEGNGRFHNENKPYVKNPSFPPFFPFLHPKDNFGKKKLGEKRKLGAAPSLDNGPDVVWCGGGRGGGPPPRIVKKRKGDRK